MNISFFKSNLHNIVHRRPKQQMIETLFEAFKFSEIIRMGSSAFFSKAQVTKHEQFGFNGSPLKYVFKDILLALIG